jgi:NlpC/P60 family putative phage cell wall peptidase
MPQHTDPQQARASVIAEALAWVGTPYHHHGRIKGVGVDCAMLLAEVYEAAGIIPRLDAGFYPRDWHLHRGEEVFLDWMRLAGGREISDPKPGDAAVFRFGRTFSHGAIVESADLTLIHAYVGRGVIRSRLSEEPLYRRECKFFTLFSE